MARRAPPEPSTAQGEPALFGRAILIAHPLAIVTAISAFALRRRCWQPAPGAIEAYPYTWL